MKKILFIITVLLGAISCGDDYVPYCLIIDNRTSDTITILDTKFAYSFVSNPNSCSEFFKANMRVIYNYDCNPKINENSFIINTHSSRKLIKKIWVADNWLCSGSTKKGWVLTFIIAEKDLE
ncbi:hypothetical protein AGMMS50262_23960 [Bacteroidia bacterium]|nr:hypothetical protein AGMMS50262_23960 [Bacteroidia bacterium]GHU75292.1 hypothetical protein FACS189413_19840 [Bacteroidia bacterium]